MSFIPLTFSIFVIFRLSCFVYFAICTFVRFCHRSTQIATVNILVYSPGISSDFFICYSCGAAHVTTVPRWHFRNWPCRILDFDLWWLIITRRAPSKKQSATSGSISGDTSSVNQINAARSIVHASKSINTTFDVQPRLCSVYASHKLQWLASLGHSMLRKMVYVTGGSYSCLRRLWNTVKAFLTFLVKISEKALNPRYLWLCVFFSSPIRTLLCVYSILLETVGLFR